MEAIDEAGALIAFVAGRRASIDADVAPRVPSHWNTSAWDLPWGTAVIAGPAVLVADDKIVVGTAVSDPWGVPREPLSRAELLERFLRYGSQVIQLAAGPFVVADTTRGSITRAVNGIVPLFTARGERIAIGTDCVLVAALAGARSAAAAPSGSEAFVDGASRNVARVATPEALRDVDLVALGIEIEGHLNDAGLEPLLGDHPHRPHGFRLLTDGVAVIASVVPCDAALVLGSRQALGVTRAAIGRLWWSLGREGRSLFVPALERPSLDSLFLALGRSA